MQNIFELILGWLSNIIFKKNGAPGQQAGTMKYILQSFHVRLHVCFGYQPVSQSQRPSTGSAVQGVPDLGLFAGGTCFDGEQASGGTLVVQDCYLDWTERNGERVVMHQLKYQWTKCLRSITSWLPLPREPFKRCFDFKMTATRAALMHVCKRQVWFILYLSILRHTLCLSPFLHDLAPLELMHSIMSHHCHHTYINLGDEYRYSSGVTQCQSRCGAFSLVSAGRWSSPIVKQESYFNKVLASIFCITKLVFAENTVCVQM